MRASIRSALSGAWFIIKLVIPLYILADVLLYFDLLSPVSFLFKPLTGMLFLPQEAAVALAAGVLLNIYAAIAFAAPLGLNGFQWTILGVFLGVCHSLPVESAIMSRLRVSYGYSVLLRITVACLAVLPVLFLPQSWFHEVLEQAQPTAVIREGFGQMLSSSLLNAASLTFKIVCLISVLSICLDLLNRSVIITKKLRKVNALFSIIVGLFLGITYGGTLLARELQQGSLTTKDLFFVATFLMICHSVVEDILLFVLLGANFWVIFSIRMTAALFVSVSLSLLVPRVSSFDLFIRK
ncbi:MAG: nucleoside recognition protein [Desulfobulbus propionicus]|nr:MAG: nucleoside recognition protein [Desulfobulbus propionicus]